MRDPTRKVCISRLVMTALSVNKPELLLALNHNRGYTYLNIIK